MPEGTSEVAGSGGGGGWVVGGVCPTWKLKKKCNWKKKYPREAGDFYIDIDFICMASINS